MLNCKILSDVKAYVVSSLQSTLSSAFLNAGLIISGVVYTLVRLVLERGLCSG